MSSSVWIGATITSFASGCPTNSEVIIQDEVLGEVRIAPGEVDDFVIRKADGFLHVSLCRRG